ncbi:MAG: carboxypeptidase-like regulatory domain-containing protein, partial [Bacteroidales bacterium]|nr:carboxypeptidase-like regulatory domain-containing protein [Bacteroidales bacterium]
MIHSMMKAAFGILLILLCQQMNAQTITGKVTDERKQPLDAALVWLVTPTNNQTVAKAITNADGSFSLPCIDKEVKLIVTCLGYSSYTSEAFQADMPKDWGTVTLAEESRLL